MELRRNVCTILYISACQVDNHIRRFKRPEWIARRRRKDMAAH